MRQRVSVREHFRRGNAATILIVALQPLGAPESNWHFVPLFNV